MVRAFDLINQVCFNLPLYFFYWLSVIYHLLFLSDWSGWAWDYGKSNTMWLSKLGNNRPISLWVVLLESSLGVLICHISSPVKKPKPIHVEKSHWEALRLGGELPSQSPSVRVPPPSDCNYMSDARPLLCQTLPKFLFYRNHERETNDCCCFKPLTSE